MIYFNSDGGTEKCQWSDPKTGDEDCNATTSFMLSSVGFPHCFKHALEFVSSNYKDTKANFERLKASLERLEREMNELKDFAKQHPEIGLE